LASGFLVGAAGLVSALAYGLGTGAASSAEALWAVAGVSALAFLREYGWCSIKEIWNPTSEKSREINHCAEHLDRPIFKLVTTLLHNPINLPNMLHHHPGHTGDNTQSVGIAENLSREGIK